MKTASRSLRNPCVGILPLTLGALLYTSLSAAQDVPIVPAAPADPALPAEPSDALTPESELAADPAAQQTDTQAVVVDAPVEEAHMELSAAELAELGLGTSGGGTAAVDTALKLSGFMDFTTSALLVGKDSPWRGALGRHPSFYIGSFNLFLSKNLTENVRTFGEVRFTYLPNGSAINGSPSGEVISTLANDYTDNNRQLRWGGIEIERVYLEWAMHENLTLRVGQFLTPYGIWNVDHGSPVIIPVQRPFTIGQALFPERQTGFELYGRASLSSSHALGYHLTVSNGFGPVSEYRDYDDNKAVGGRVYWNYDGFGELRLGGSAFYGRDTAAVEIAGLSVGRIVYNERVTMQSDVLALALDLQWKFKNLILQGEFITQQRRYTDQGRTGAPHPLIGNQYIAPKDGLALGAYALAGYRFDWLGTMPYLVAQYIDYVEPTQFSRIRVNGVTTGLNIRPIDAAVVKIEYVFGGWPKGYLLTDDAIHLLQAQLAWAF